MGRLVLHAPGVHVGGGMVLLKELISLKSLGDVWTNLDERATTVNRVPNEIELHSITHSIIEVDILRLSSI